MRRYPATPADAVAADVGFDGQLRGMRIVASIGTAVDLLATEDADGVYRFIGEDYRAPTVHSTAPARLWTPTPT